MEYYRHHHKSINIVPHPLHHHAIICVVVVSAVFGVFAGRLLQLGLFLHFLRARLRSSANPRLCRAPVPAVPCRVSGTGCARCSKWKTFPGAVGAFHRPLISSAAPMWIPYHVISIHNCILLVKFRSNVNLHTPAPYPHLHQPHR